MAIVAIIGLVLLFKGGLTGRAIVAQSRPQFTPPPSPPPQPPAVAQGLPLAQNLFPSQSQPLPSTAQAPVAAVPGVSFTETFDTLIDGSIIGQNGWQDLTQSGSATGIQLSEAVTSTNAVSGTKSWNVQTAAVSVAPGGFIFHEARNVVPISAPFTPHNIQFSVTIRPETPPTPQEESIPRMFVQAQQGAVGVQSQASVAYNQVGLSLNFVGESVVDLSIPLNWNPNDVFQFSAQATSVDGITWQVHLEIFRNAASIGSQDQVVVLPVQLIMDGQAFFVIGNDVNVCLFCPPISNPYIQTTIDDFIGVVVP